MLQFSLAQASKGRGAQLKATVAPEPSEILRHEPSPALGDRPVELGPKTTGGLQGRIRDLSEPSQPYGAVVGRHSFGRYTGDNVQPGCGLRFAIEEIRSDAHDTVAGRHILRF